MRGSEWCYFHDPALASQRHDNSVKAGKSGFLHWRIRRRERHEARLRRAAASERARILEQINREAQAQPTERAYTQHPADCACCHNRKPTTAKQTVPTSEDISKAKAEQRERQAELQRLLIAEAMRAEQVRRYITPQTPAPEPQPTPCGIAGVEI